jgi:predicted 2-oxoglutarate/Fe(II)-dependent dioxygenase YbiX/peroxiredoxin
MSLEPAVAAPLAASRPRQFAAGDLIPMFTARTDTNPRFHFATVGGAWVVLLFLGSLSAPAGRHAHERATARRHLFDDVDGQLFGVSIDPADKAERGLKNAMPGMRYFWDFDVAVSRGYGFAVDGAFHPTALLLDRTMRVVAQAPARDIDSLLDLMERHIAEDRRAAEQPFAPVLQIPRVLEPELCAELIAYYGTHGGKASGHMTVRDDMTVAELDTTRKRRSDCHIRDEDLRATVRRRIERRLIPMIAHAFGWQATRVERYIVGCYSGADNGFFFPHRDNTTHGTAHRKFAVTLNLNADDYEGGELRFPEFGPRLYKPPTGGAVVFGCRMLHEAMPVTSGVRYAFLPFLYDEAGAQLRAANLHKLAPLEGPLAG